MKKNLIFLSFFILVSGLICFFQLQFSENNLTKEKKIALTPAEIKQKEIALKRNRKEGKSFDKPSQFVQFHHHIRTREGKAEPGYPMNYRMHELTKARQKISNKRTKALDWIERGPANVPGRTRIVLPLDDPDKNTWLAGSVGGGIWKTTDAGQSWSLKTPGFPNLATSTLAMPSPSSNIIYAGTGEGFYNLDAINGTGMFKSLDQGDTWIQLESTVNNRDFININRIIVDPENPDVVLICSNSGRYSDFRSAIFRSSDGGASWTNVYDADGRVQQLLFDPTDFNRQYATVYGRGILISSDGGITWSNSSDGIVAQGRIELAIAPTNPQVMYASVEGNLTGTGSDLYISQNGGELWSLVVEVNDGVNYNWLGDQGWYDNSIAVHPFDENVVYVGGINLWKMAIVDQGGQVEYQVVDVEEVNTQSFLAWVNFSGLFLNGGLTTGPDWFKENAAYPVDLEPGDFTSVEIRFGPGISQMAHRFTVPAGAGAGVPPADYTYQDYVEVPFEVWDVINNQQLMVSFRDQERNGVFDLEERDQADDTRGREYIFINAVPYDANTPSPEITRVAGMAYKTLYAMWPILTTGATWTPNDLPVSEIRIQTTPKKYRQTTNMTDSYQEIDGKNSNVHVDHHHILPLVINEAAQTFKLVNANDGGVYVSNTGTDPGVAPDTWFFAGNEYNTGQFYGIDKKRGEEQYIGGLQDNGTWRSNPAEVAGPATLYLFQIGGDGFDVVWNNADPEKIIGSSQFNTFSRSLDGGATWQLAISGLDDNDEDSAPFITKLANSKSNPEVLFAIGSSGVWRSDNFGENWTGIPINSKWQFGTFTDIKVSQANNQIVWAGSAMSSNGNLHVSTDGGQTFQVTNNYTQANLGPITGIETHPFQDSTAFALFSFADAPKILRTTDLGQTWTDITGYGSGTASTNGFPDVAVYSLFVLPHEPNTIWAGTEIGLVESTDNGASWSLANNGLPNTAIWEMKLVDTELVVATHGRGIWTVDLPVENQIVFAPLIEDFGVSPQGELVFLTNLRGAYDSIRITVNKQEIGRIIAPEMGLQFFTITDFPAGDTANLVIDAYNSSKTLQSNRASTFYFEVNDPVNSYSSDFNNFNESDFYGNGYAIVEPEGFTDPAIHSLHPYGRNTDYYYYLRSPVIISADNPRLAYDDIAIIEPGEAGTVFLDDEFWDYVIVEGTTNGLEWLPLMPGYDARLQPEWLEAYDNDQTGDNSLFFSQEHNLTDVFAPEDTVLLRFRLHSDPEAVGWGWAIDNLLIQTNTLVNVNDAAINENFDITSYPNPASHEVDITYTNPLAGPVIIQFWNVKGQKIDEIDLGYRPAGASGFIWQTDQKGMIILRLKTRFGEKTSRVLFR
ncbi:MAG: hypothetical protein ACNS62_01425 [Candidatus Cyclobacteriaceae bacterium M3_2C_046]